MGWNGAGSSGWKRNTGWAGLVTLQKRFGSCVVWFGPTMIQLGSTRGFTPWSPFPIVASWSPGFPIIVSLRRQVLPSPFLLLLPPPPPPGPSIAAFPHLRLLPFPVTASRGPSIADFPHLRLLPFPVTASRPYSTATAGSPPHQQKLELPSSPNLKAAASSSFPASRRARAHSSTSRVTTTRSTKAAALTVSSCHESMMYLGTRITRLDPCCYWILS